jgi:hypothetical protein
MRLVSLIRCFAPLVLVPSMAVALRAAFVAQTTVLPFFLPKGEKASYLSF